MRQIILAIIFLATTAVFADVTIINMPGDENSSNAACSSSANTYSRQACKAMMEARKNRANANAPQNQTAVPPAQMPAWQQALQPPEVTAQDAPSK